LSKEIAQTVGGKKIAFLFAILAAFAVFATLGSRLDTKPASAISGQTFTAAPAFGSNVLLGSNITYTLSATQDSGVAQFTLTIPAQTTYVSNTCAANGGVANLASGNTVINCQWAAAVATARTFSVTVTVTSGANGDVLSAGAAYVDSTTPVAVALLGVHNLLVATVTFDKNDAGSDPVNAAGSGFYNYVFTNTSAVAGTNAVALGLNDTLPTQFIGTTFTFGGAWNPIVAPAVAPTCVVGVGGATFACSGGVLGPLQVGSIRLNYNVGINIANGTVVCNDAAAIINGIVTGSGVADTVNEACAGGPADAGTTVNSVVGIEFTKIPNKSTVTSVPVESLAWLYQVKNTGTAPLTGVVLTDPTVQGAPAGSATQTPDPQNNLGNTAGCNSAANVLNCPIGTVAAGGATTVVLGISTILGAVGGVGGVVNNTANVVTNETGSVDSNTNFVIKNNPILNISKSFSTATVGHVQTSTYTWTVTNVGAAVANNVVVSDAVPAGLTGSAPTAGTVGVVTGQTCTLTGGGATTMQPASSISCTITVVLTALSTPPAGTSFLNTASVVSDEQPQATTASAIVAAVVPVLSITKTSSGTITTTTGGFTITVTNTGTTAANPVTITDTAPAGVTFTAVSGPGTCNSAANLAAGCNAGSLAPNASAIVLITATKNLNVVDGTVITNTATAGAPNAATVVASANVTAQAPKLVVTKVASKDPVSSIPVNEQFAWYITVTNTGSVDATALTVTDTFSGSTPLATAFQPAGCTVAGQVVTCTTATLAVGSSVTFAIAVTANTQATNGTALNNTATANCTNCPAAASGTGNTHILNNPLLNMTKTGPSTVIAGGSVVYNIAVSNTGGAAATVTVTDSVPGLLGATATVTNNTTTLSCSGNNTSTITCTGSLAAGASGTITITGTVPANTPSGTNFSNQATLTSFGQPTITGVVVSTVQNSLLTVQKVNNPTLVGPGGLVTSTILVTNNGSTSASNVSIFDDLPAGTTFVSLGSSPTCFGAGSVLSTLTAAVSNSSTLNVASGANFVVGELITVGGSNVTVTAVNGNTITVSQNVTATNGSSVTLQGAASQEVACIGPALAPGSSTTFIVVWNIGATTGQQCNVATSANNSGMPNGTATACASAVAAGATGVLRHVDVDAASESAAGFASGILPWQDDDDDATGSLHRVCLIDATLGLNQDAAIVWSITPAAGSSATVSPAPSGTKSVRSLLATLVWPLPPAVAVIPGTAADTEANCVDWRSGGTGGQNITATYTVTGQVFYWNASPGTAPAIKEWNRIDSTRLVRVGVAPATATVALFGPADGDTDTDTSFGDTNEINNWTGQAIAQLDNCSRDSNWSNLDFDCVSRPDLSGTTLSVGGTLIVVDVNTGKLIAPARTFIDYTLGSHVNYNGPIDGVRQTYTISGSCGSAIIENPETGNLITIAVGGVLTASLLNSDKGVAFTIFPTPNGLAATAANANCRPNDTTTITIESTEDVALRSDINSAAKEVITIVWTSAAPANKQPILAWAGQRVVLENDWSRSIYDAPTGTCFVDEDGGFYVNYAKQAQGPGQFINSLTDAAGNIRPYYTYNTDEVIVRVLGFNLSPAERIAPNTNCISTAMYESQDPGEVDVSAYIGEVFSNGTFTGTSQQVDFLIYYMKFESITIGIVDGARAFHNSGSFSVSNPWDESKDKTTAKVNVSSDVLVRLRVKGWFTNTNPTGRAAGEDTNKGVLPAGRWVMPDDWNQLAGGAQANDRRPNYDIMISPAGVLTCSVGINANDFWQTATCQAESLRPATSLATLGLLGTQTPIVGPFSLVDGPGGADSVAPRKNPKLPQTTGALAGFRQTWLPDRTIDKWDAPMPVAQVKVSINATGAGFLKYLSPTQLVDSATGGPVNGAADKYRIYTKNPFYAYNIPAEPWISQYNSDGSGYLWNTWGSGTNSGEYRFWFDAAAVSTRVYSANGKDGLCKYQPNLDDVYDQLGLCTQLKFAGNAVKRDTGGYLSLTFYSDNHGEVMAYANGDAGLTMDECSDAASLAANGVVAASVGSVYCEKGDLVGKSSISANVDYPDKRKHYPLGTAAPVTVDWTWGGVKAVTLEKGAVSQFIYVVFHVTDRDGFCTVPTTQFIYTDINVNGTVTLLPLFVRTNSSTQPLVDKIGNDGRIPPALFSGFTLQQIPLPRYAGYTVPSGIVILPLPVTGPPQYQATTTDTGYPYVVAVGAYSLHPVWGEKVTFQLDVITGGSIVEVPNGTIGILGQSAESFTFDTADPSQVNNVIKPLKNDPECQTWIRVSNSLLGVGNVLVTAYDPEGTIQFDRIIDFQSTTSYSLSFRWSLITWAGANNISVSDALKGTGANDAGNDIFDQVTAVYGWEQASQNWLGFFPAGVNVPGANDLTKLIEGSAYWIAIKGPSSVTWTIATNVN
jgi:uncharacterized repeat protein (TIGR01451 family)